jgi:hypothetical protein
MSDEKVDRTPAPSEEPEDVADEDDVEGHVMMRTGLSGANPADDDEDVEGHALFRSPASRGE